jgi:hypothetical protein
MGDDRLREILKQLHNKQLGVKAAVTTSGAAVGSLETSDAAEGSHGGDTAVVPAEPIGGTAALQSGGE